jgi:amino acid transporter
MANPLFCKIALGVSSLALLCAIIGLATPLYPADYRGVEYKWGVKDSEAGSHTTDQWDVDCGSNDDCKSAQSMLKGCFAFIFLGMLVNVAVIVSLVKACGFDQGKLPAPLGQKMPTVIMAAVLFVFYLIGMALGLAAIPKALENQSTIKDEAKPGAGSALLIIAWIFTIAIAILSFLGIGEGDAAPAGDVENPATVPPAAGKPADPAPAAGDKPAEAPGAAAPVASDKPVEAPAPASDSKPADAPVASE